MKTITFGFDTYDIYDNTSVKNVRFEDHDSIVKLPIMIGNRTINWLEENNIPYERIKGCDLPESLRQPYVLGIFHYDSGFGVKTNINPDDLRMMALTLATEEKDDCRTYTSNDDNSEDDDVQKMIDMFGDLDDENDSEEDEWIDFC